MYAFGSGALWGTSTSIAGGSPVKFGVLQDVTFDFQRTEKELYGQYQFPVAVGASAMKATGKAKLAKINGLLLSQLFFGATPTAGQQAVEDSFQTTVPAATPYSVTVVPPTSGTFVGDLGVVYTATGQPLELVTSPTAAGQYSVSGAGVYTFDSADASAGVSISYMYSLPTGLSLTVSNPLMGLAPTFKAVFQAQYNGRILALSFNQCMSQKLSLATKIEDWTIPEFDFIVLADSNNNVLTISTAD